MLKILVANKSDIENPAVKESEGRELAEKFGLEFYSTSAKNGTGVEEMFTDTCSKVISAQ